MVSEQSVVDRVAKAFPIDTAKHELLILHDDGVYRHLRWREPGTRRWTHGVDITTWPGHLAISGDMGSYVFHREHDMVGFFRGKEPSFTYWAEKVVAQDQSSPVKVKTPYSLRSTIKDWAQDHAYGLFSRLEDVKAFYRDVEAELLLDLVSEYDIDEVESRWQNFSMAEAPTGVTALSDYHG